MNALSSRIERRLLVNWRADPDVVAPLLPAPFQPQRVEGSAVVGICFIRLADVRPRWAPTGRCVRSESAAHRIAVEWDDAGRRCTGVFVVRRDTSSRLAALVGGRLFPGVHSHATFEVDEAPDRLRVSFTTDDGAVSAAIDARSTATLQSDLFPDVDSASTFFRGGNVGWSPCRSGGIEGVELDTTTWPMEPVAIDSARSSFYDDTARFPADAIQLDSALLMRDLRVTWRTVDDRPVLAASRVSASRITTR